MAWCGFGSAGFCGSLVLLHALLLAGVLLFHLLSLLGVVGGRRIAHRYASTGTITYYAEDMLGTARVILPSTAGSPCYDGDFYPFGGEREYTSTCAENYKFEGKKRDQETGNDDFGARYYSSSFGRWESPDWSSTPEPVPYANLANPQTLNLYGMVKDNPETFADLDGHDPTGGTSLMGTQQNRPGQDPANATQQGTAAQTSATPSQNQSSSGTSSKELAARAVLLGEAALNTEIAKIKLSVAEEQLELSEATGGATAVTAAYTAVSAAGNSAAAGIQVTGAITGKTADAAKEAESVTTVTSVLGFSALVGTKSLDKAATAAAAEGIITSDPLEVMQGKPVEVIAKVIDYAKSAWDALNGALK